MKDKTLDQLEAEYGERHAEPDVDQVISVRAARHSARAARVVVARSNSTREINHDRR